MSLSQSHHQNWKGTLGLVAEVTVQFIILCINSQILVNPILRQRFFLFKFQTFTFLRKKGEEDDVRDGDDGNDEEEDKQILRDKNLEMCPPSLLNVYIVIVFAL